MSIIVFSDRKSAAPSLTMRRAAASSILPSNVKCCLSTSGFGLFVRASKTSSTVSFPDDGNLTAATRDKNSLITRTYTSSIHFHLKHISQPVKMSTHFLDGSKIVFSFNFICNTCTNTVIINFIYTFKTVLGL